MTACPRRRWRASSHLHAHKRSGGGAWGLLQTSAALWSQLGGRDSFRLPLHSCPVAMVDHVVSKLQCPSSRGLPAPGAWRETSSQAKIADLNVQASRWTLHSGDKVQPAWAFLLRPKKCPRKCHERHEPKARAFQGLSQLQRQLLRIPETEMAIGSHLRKRGERMSVGRLASSSTTLGAVEPVHTDHGPRCILKDCVNAVPTRQCEGQEGGSNPA